MNLDGRVITQAQIAAVLAVTPTGSFRPKFPVLHNTSQPDIKLYNSWMARGNPSPEQWLKNLAAYYRGLGWASMPHAFILPDGRIGLGAPFSVQGTHSPSWNNRSIGIEMVGEFERETFDGTPTEAAAIVLFGELCKHFGWDPNVYVRGVSGIHFHKEDPSTTHKTCPGKNVNKTLFVQKVMHYMGQSPGPIAAAPDVKEHINVPEKVQVAKSADEAFEEAVKSIDPTA